MITKFLFTIFSIFLVYRTFIIFSNLNSSVQADFTLVQSLILAFLLSIYITGIFAFLGFVYPTRKLLSDQYYSIKNPLRIKKIYDILGLKYFKFFLLFMFWGKEKNRKKYFNGTKSRLHNFIYQTRQSEFGHLLSFIAIQLFAFYLLYEGYFFISLFSSILNIIGNLFPVILQRYHRVRIARLKLNSISK